MIVCIKDNHPYSIIDLTFARSREIKKGTKIFQYYESKDSDGFLRYEINGSRYFGFNFEKVDKIRSDKLDSIGI